MINTTDLSEFEILLPGDWVRKDSGDIYSFTNDNMQLVDERLFKELYISHPPDPQRKAVHYALTIKDDYCGIIAGDEEFIITEIGKRPDGSAFMEWADQAGLTIDFERRPGS